MTITEQIYGNRFAAFVDILGFKQMIKQIEEKSLGHELLFERLKSVLKFLNDESIESNGHHDLPIYKMVDDGMLELELGDPRITYISDCAIISTEGTFDGFKSICNKLTKLSTDLACDGMFVRGAIAYGPLYHDKKFVFGSAYQRAYEVESTISSTPRIVVDTSALNFLSEHSGTFPLNDFGTRLDGDGRRYLHCFPCNYHPIYTYDWIGFLLRVKGHILSSLNQYDARVSGFPTELKAIEKYYCWRDVIGSQPDFTGSDEKVLRKYHWLKDEFNRTLAQHSKYLINAAGEPRILNIVDLGTHWGPERNLGHRR